MTDFAPAWLACDETQRVIQALGEDSIRFVGGCVRDALLGRSVTDVDMASILLPERVMELLTHAGIKAVPTGITHGTVTAVVGKRSMEITTLRKDVSTDGRHATVEYTSQWQEDAARRDFTMNALYADTQGNITDYFGGIEDARAGRVRFIGDAHKRIEEDGLRILRFFRFVAGYNTGTIDLDGLAACASNARLLDTLSGERIAQEMRKLLLAPGAADVVVLMQQYNVWQKIVPCVVGVATLRRLRDISAAHDYHPTPMLALALLLRSVPEHMAEAVENIEKRWKLSHAEQKQLRRLCLADYVPTEITQQKRYLRKLGVEAFHDSVILCEAENDYSAHEALGAFTLAATWSIPEFPVNGHDLKAVGIADGKALGDALRSLEEKWELSEYTLGKARLLDMLK